MLFSKGTSSIYLLIQTIPWCVFMHIQRIKYIWYSYYPVHDSNKKKCKTFPIEINPSPSNTGTPHIKGIDENSRRSDSF